MLEREKVIRGLKCHSAHGYEMCFDCPYYTGPDDFIYKGDDDLEGVCCEEKLASDALALLREQEPRVIYDASEIKLDTVYWMEKKNIVTPWPVAMKMYSQRLPEQLEFEDYYGERWTVSRYLVGREGWRLWTARPTDEQRREASWHG